MLLVIVLVIVFRSSYFSEKKNSNTLVEIEGKCNYRNPIGFLTSYPRNFREDQSRVESSVNERSHELILGVFATQQGTDMPKLSRIEGKRDREVKR